MKDNDTRDIILSDLSEWAHAAVSLATIIEDHIDERQARVIKQNGAVASALVMMLSQMEQRIDALQTIENQRDRAERAPVEAVSK